ncbi:MAG: carbohydrate ABC transporter permease [Fervidobacterium sp.]
MKREAKFGILLVMPAFTLLAMVYIYPLLYNVDLSFSRWNLSPPSPKEYVGLENYLDLFSSGVFLKVFYNTLFFTIMSVPLEFILGLGLALLLNQDIKGKNAVITILALPMMIAPVVAALTWRWVYAYDYGILNFLLNSLFGMEPLLWLSSKDIAMYSVIIADVWVTTPFMMLIIYAGLQMIPTELYEAAKIDGASSWQMFRSVTLPSLKSVLIVALMIRTIDAFTKLFDVVYVLTGGGPAYATEVLPTYAYKVGLSFFRLGSGAAIAMITLTVAAIMIAAISIASRGK